MERLKKKAIMAILLGSTMPLFLILIAIFDYDNTTGALWIWCVYSVAVLIAMFIILPPKDLMEYGRLQVKQLKAKRKNEVTYLKPPHSKYKGVTRTYTRNRTSFLVIFAVLFTSIPVIFLLFPEYDFKSILVVTGSFLLLLYQLYLLIFETVTITPEFIRCRHWLKNYTIHWSDIKTIGITLDRYGKAADWISYIYVSTDILKEDVVDISKGKINNTFIFVAYRVKVVLHILANYNGEIKNLSMVNSWIRYLRKNQ